MEREGDPGGCCCLSSHAGEAKQKSSLSTTHDGFQVCDRVHLYTSNLCVKLTHSLTHAAAEKKGLSFDTNRNERSHLRGLWIVIVIVIVIVIGPEDPPASCVDETEGGGVSWGRFA